MILRHGQYKPQVDIRTNTHKKKAPRPLAALDWFLLSELRDEVDTVRQSQINTMNIGALPRRCRPQVKRTDMHGALHSRSAIPRRLTRGLITVVSRTELTARGSSVPSKNRNSSSRKDASGETSKSHGPSRTKFPARQMQNRA